MRGLKIWTLRFAIWARRSRRISSSLLPLNMLPTTTSIQPAPALCVTSISLREASPLGLPYTRSRSPRRRLAPIAWLTHCARSHRSHLLLVLAVFGPDADHVADVHVRRDLDDEAGLERRRLDLRARRGAVDARGRVHHLEVHGHRQLDADRLVAVELHRDGRFGNDVVRVVAEDLDVEVDLLVAARVHEVERVAVAVEILHLPLVENGALDVLFGAELVVGLLAGADVPHPRLHEAALVARREMREIEDAIEIGAHLDQHAPLHPRRLY